MQRAYSILTVKSVGEDERVIRGVASTPRPDRVDDVMNPLGAIFALPMALLLHHDAKSPVGHVEFAQPTKDGIPYTARILKSDEPGRVKDRLDEAWHSVKLGLIRAVSIGFRGLEAKMLKSGGTQYDKWEWLELSLVTIPANAEATITTIKAVDTALRAASGHAQGDDDPSLTPGATGLKTPATPKRRGGVSPMKTIAEQITALEAARQSKAAQMASVMQKSVDEGRSTDTSEQEEFDTLESEIGSIDADLKRFRSLEKAQAFKATSVDGVKDAQSAIEARGGIGHNSGVQNITSSIKMPEKLEKGIEFSRYVLCVAQGKGNLMQSVEIAKSRYGENSDVIGLIKAAVAAGTTTDATWAGPLVDLYTRYTGDFVEFLRPQTIIGKFGMGSIPSLRRVPFNVNIVEQTSGGDGYWVGEGKPKPLTKFDYTSVNLRWAKVANIAVLTEETLRLSNPSAKSEVRRALAAALISRLDTDFVDPTKAAVSNVSPASITNGVTPIPSSGIDADAIREDVAVAMSAYIDANITPTEGVWIMPATIALRLSLMRNALGQKEWPELSMMGGTFEGLPVIVSQYVPTITGGSYVILANASDIWLADDGQVTIDASREASLQMLDNPTNNSGAGTATTMVSMFQTNSVALRAERWINWQKRRSAAVQVIDGVNWGAAA